MLVADREYVAADGAADVDRAVQKALERAAGRPGKHAGVVAEPASTLRRTWFDTFDWRLHRAGFALQRTERSKATGPERLTLTAGDDVLMVLAPAVQAAARVAYPLDRVVPTGPMRSLLEPVVEMRALLPLATQRFSVRSYRVLNDDDKTVARVVIEHPAWRSTRSAEHALASKRRRVTWLFCGSGGHGSGHRENPRPHAVRSVDACASTGSDAAEPRATTRASSTSRFVARCRPSTRCGESCVPYSTLPSATCLASLPVQTLSFCTTCGSRCDALVRH